MRIISGTARGLRIEAPPGRTVRPTTDRVREAVFAALGDVRGLHVVDLFAGSGALGLEALSRGAAATLFVEKTVRHIRVIERNLAKVLHALTAAGVPGPKARILQCDVRSLSRRAPDWFGAADLVFADPPYHPARGAYGGAALLSDPEFARWANQALLVLEHAADAPPVSGSENHLWRLVSEKRYGSVAVSFLRPAGMP